MSKNVVKVLLLGSAIGLSVACGKASSGENTGSQSSDLISAPIRAEALQACPGPYENHGQCVSCLAHAVNDLWHDDAITAEDKDGAISSFAEGECKAALDSAPRGAAGASGVRNGGLRADELGEGGGKGSDPSHPRP